MTSLTSRCKTFSAHGSAALFAALLSMAGLAAAADTTQALARPAVSHAAPNPDALSAGARHIADWVAASHDNRGAEFVIVDKKSATVHVFDASAKLTGSTPVLLGAATGDDSVPGIGDRPIAEVRPEERTTPAGRFNGERGRNAQGEDVVWVDYDAAVSMHRVRANNPKERRLERLATPTPEDNRISYGCINVPAAFYDAQIRPIFAKRTAVVYVLPEVKSLRQVFGPNLATPTATATAAVAPAGPSAPR